jgi:drug/metabolite transporter (DMT)-like permease
MKFSRTAAVILGIFVPIAETVRRWHTWREAPMSLFDDYILAVLVLYGAWLVGRDFRRGQSFLAAAWGIACGVGYGSFFGQLDRLKRGEPDPAPIPSLWVAVIKGALFVLAIAALVATLRARRGGAVEQSPARNVS